MLYQRTMTFSTRQISTVFQPRHRSHVTPSMYAQISRGHSISTNRTVNSQSVILTVLISIDVQTEISFLTNKCRYTAWKLIKSSFSSNLLTLNLRSPYTYIRNLIKHQRIHKIENAISSHARCLAYSAVLIFGAFTKLRKETIRFVMSVCPSFRTGNSGEYDISLNSSYNEKYFRQTLQTK